MPIQTTYLKKYQSITKDFLQDHINKLVIDEKNINKINRDKNSYKVNIESIDKKDRRFPVSPNDFPLASIVTPINEKTPPTDFTFLNMPKNHKPINNEKGKQIRETESRIDTMVKYDEGNTYNDI